jgi:DNA-binding transcriptional LysR family regulator
MSLSSLHLEAFFMVAQTSNFTQAAKRLHVTQSALSQRILNLEADLETTLFIRDRAGLILTEMGLELLRYCQAKEGLETEFLQQLRSGSAHELAGVIRVAGFSSVMRSVIMPALTPLLQANPTVRLQAQTGELAKLLNLLKRGEVDFIVLDQRIELPELNLESLGIEHNVLTEKKGYIGPEIYLDHDEADSVTFRYLQQIAGAQSGKKLTAAGLASATKAPANASKLKRHYLGDIYSLIDGVRSGLGRAVLPLHLIRGMNDIKILNPTKLFEIPVILHTYQAPYYSRLHKAVVERLKLSCKEAFHPRAK